MPIMYRCPGELRHVTRGFLYDERNMADEAAALADGWAHTLEEAAGLAPIAADQPSASVPQAEQQPEPMTREGMIAALEAAGVDVDKRWGDKRLAAEMAKLKG